MQVWKLFALLALFFLGSAIAAGVDTVLGIHFKYVGMNVEIAHKMVYMVWGGSVVTLANRLFGRR